VKAGADVVVLDGMQGGTAATQDVFIEHVGIPTLAAIRPAVQALKDLGMHRKVQLIVSGGVRNGADVAKILALGADAASIGTAALVALGDNDPRWEEEYRKLGTTAGAYDDWHEGRDPAGITTQDPALSARLDPVLAGRRLANFLQVMTLELQTIARACGKSNVRNLEPEDLVALTVEAAAMAGVPLAGTSWVPGGERAPGAVPRLVPLKSIGQFLVKSSLIRYMVIGPSASAAPTRSMARLAERGRMLPDGLAYVDSWLDASGARWMETADPALFAPWIAAWDDLVAFEVVPLREAGLRADQQGDGDHGEDGSGEDREGEGDRILPDLLHRPVRRDARQARAGRGHRRHAEERRRFRGLRDLARHDAGLSRHVRRARPRQPDPAALEARSRLARRRSVDGRQGGRAGPRNTLKRVLAEAEGQGYRMKHGVECEFFLITPEGDAIADGADTQAKPCYDISALMRRYEVIKAICDAMQALGWGAYQNDHEDANGQFEMNWEYDDALVTADRHAFFKYMVKTIAEAHGLRATFMPKPFPNLTGNGCHAHVSLWDKAGKKNLFDDKKGELGVSKQGYHFLGGVMAHAEALAAFFAPTVNSYKRLNAPRTTSGATWSPNTITYGGNNRTHMVRIPDPGRFEFRLADGAANPYLYPAALLAAGSTGWRASWTPASGSTSTCMPRATPSTRRSCP
jgi:hypothetical protein